MQHHIQKTRVLIFTTIRISNLTNFCDSPCVEPPVTGTDRQQGSTVCKKTRKTLKKIKTGYLTQIIHIINVIFFLNTYCNQATYIT
jgi:hypothetical protein